MTTELEVVKAWLKFAGGSPSTQVWPDALPQSAPCPLPQHLPGLLGSLESSSPEDVNQYSAQLLFHPLESLAAQDEFLRQVTPAFLTLGWRAHLHQMFRLSGLLTHSENRMMESMTDSPPADPPMTLRHDQTRTVATWGSVVGDGRVFLQLDVRTGFAYHHLSRGEDQALRLPALQPPASLQTEQLAGGGAGNGRSATLNSAVLLQGEATVSVIHDHYAQQLLHLDWQQRTATLGAGVGCSVWTTPQGDLSLLSVLERDVRSWQATLQVTQFAAGGPSGSSWYSL